MHYDSVSVDNTQAKAEMFNHYFYSVFTRSEFGSSIVANTQSVESGLNVIEVSEEEEEEEEDVYRALVNLNPNKTMGLDEIGLSVLKFYALPLCSIICHLLTHCLDHQKLPLQWKQDRIISIHKSREKDMFQSYQHISLRCAISKVFESVVYANISKVKSCSVWFPSQ